VPVEGGRAEGGQAVRELEGQNRDRERPQPCVAVASLLTLVDFLLG